MGVQAPAPSFVGRGAELAEVARLLGSSRLVTLVGVGGAGKTRLALEGAAHVAPRFGGEYVTCELAPATEPALVESRISAALGFPPEVRLDLGALAAQRFGSDPALLLLDNCEHVRPAVAAAVAAMLGAAPGLRVLATSRERLRVAGEMAWPVPPMAGDEAVELVEARARAVDAAFAVTPENRPAIADICRRLEGLPLALELVAPRLVLLPAGQVAALLDDALAVLAGGEGEARHRTMRATLDWSADLLTEQARSDLWRLAVFPSVFGLDAAAAVLDVPVTGAVDRLAALRDASLLAADRSRPSAGFRLLEPVRQYAAGHLRELPGEDDVRRRHAGHVLRSAEWIGGRLLGTPEQGAALAAFEDLLPDLRQAVAWALEREPAWAARIVGHTGWAWEITGRLREGEALERIALAGATEALDRARLLVRLRSISSRRSDPRQLVELSDAAIAAAREAGDPRELGSALGLGISGHTPEAARAMLDELLAIATKHGDVLLKGWEQFFRSHISYWEEDFKSARAHLERSIELIAPLRDEWLTTQGTANLIRLCLLLGDNVAARKHLRSNLARLVAHPDWIATPAVLMYTAMLAARTGRPADAFRLLGAQRRLVEELGALPWDQTEAEERGRAGLRNARDEERHLAEGARMSLREALLLAQSVVEEPSQRPDARLSRRELEIARLIGRGLSNKEIADGLHLSTRTVEGHVEKVLRKLDLKSRVQVATWAAEHRLLD